MLFVTLGSGAMRPLLHWATFKPVSRSKRKVKSQSLSDTFEAIGLLEAEAV